MSEIANQDQAAHWNAAAAEAWVTMQATLDALLEGVGVAVLEAGFPGESAAVLDIGCGAGATTLAMARRLGPRGRALGVDISEPMVAAARRRARAEGVDGAEFLTADAQVHPFPPAAFDAAISRFGVMFFDDPTTAFANIRRALKRGGKLAFAAWRSPAENPFMTAASRAARPFLPDLPTPDPDAPGQFAFADADKVRAILSASGWSGVEVRPLDVPAAIARDELVRYITTMGPVGLALQALDEAARAPIAKVVVEALEPFVEDGVGRFTMACWLATARA